MESNNRDKINQNQIQNMFVPVNTQNNLIPFTIRVTVIMYATN